MTDLRTRVREAVERCAVRLAADPSSSPAGVFRRASIEVLRDVAAAMAAGRGLESAWPGDGVGFEAAAGLAPESLGELREELLGFEVRRAPPDDAVVFLGPDGRLALPRRRLAALTDAEREACAELDVVREVAPGDAYLHPVIESRKARGAFYTGDPLSRPTAEETLAPLLVDGGGPPRILDPAMGSGAFLLAAHRVLVANGYAPAVAARALHGVDLDPVAVEAARLAIWLEAGDAGLDREALEENLFPADGLFDGRLAEGTFDALLGNPPWEIVKPNSREWFARHDPFFRRLGKRDARARRARLFAHDPALEAAWDEYVAAIRALSERIRGSDAFTRQGAGDMNTWKLFLERGLRLLRDGGRLGMILPAGLATDLGAADLRRHLLADNRWEWLFTFENSRGLFDIHRSWRFGPVVVQRGGETEALRAAFMRRDPADWAAREECAVTVPRSDVLRFSPDAAVLLEFGSDDERRLLERVFAHATLVKDVPGLTYRREFDLTNHVDLFVDAERLLAEGLVRDRHGRFVDGDGAVRALPLLQGVMLRSFEFPAAAWRGGRGSRADWLDLTPGEDRVVTRWGVRIEDVRERAPAALHPRLALRDVQNATNGRTFLATLVPGFPCGNTLPVLSTGDPIEDLYHVAVFTSFVVDRVLRLRMTQNHLNLFTLRELPVPRAVPEADKRALLIDAARLALVGDVFGEVRRAVAACTGATPTELAPVTERRARIALRAAIDARVARAFGLGPDDLRLLLRDCHRPVEALRRADVTRNLDPKGFWRVDRDLPPEERQTTMVLRRA